MRHHERDWAGGDRVGSTVFVGWHLFAPLAGDGAVMAIIVSPGPKKDVHADHDCYGDGFLVASLVSTTCVAFGAATCSETR